MWLRRGPIRTQIPALGGGWESGDLPALRKLYERQQVEHRAPPPIQPYEAARGVAIDFVPLSDHEARVFFFPTKMSTTIESWEMAWGFKKGKNRKGKEITAWQLIADERNPETIESVFTEDFYVFKRDASYFFVTQSGKLYVAPPAKKGEKSRTMKALWDDAKRPIVAVLEDADNGKVWLFAKDETPSAKGGLYFEMKEKIQTESFDPAKLKPVDAPGRAKILLEYLPLIRKE
jgi:hypothetical protein